MAQLVAYAPEFFRERRRIELLLDTEALAVEPGRRRVQVRGPEGERWLGYDRLVLATGAVARWQPPPLRNLFGAHTWNDLQRLQAALAGDAGRGGVVVVGGGYIGVEMAAALAHRRLPVTLIDAHAQPLPRFHPALAARLEPDMAAAGIRFIGGARVTGLLGSPGGRVLGVSTSGGGIGAAVVVNCAGMRPQTSLASAAGLALGRWGGIAVDERQQTSVPGIYAAGDCTECRHAITAAPAWIPLGAIANKQGRVAGQNAAGGRPARFFGALGTLAVSVFGWDIGRTGLTPDEARAAGFDVTEESVETTARAGYLDARRNLALTLVYQPSTGRLLGVHMLGPAGSVAGRLDAAAVALAAGLTLDRVEMLDLAYSPALAPLYEPLLVAAHNAARGR